MCEIYMCQLLRVRRLKITSGSVIACIVMPTITMNGPICKVPIASGIPVRMRKAFPGLEKLWYFTIVLKSLKMQRIFEEI